MTKIHKIKAFKGLPLIILFSFFLFTIFSVSAQLIVQTGLLNVGRSGHESVGLNNGKILACGGYNGDPFNPVIYASSELYNPSTGTWNTTGSMNQARKDFASVLLDNGNVLVIGGMIQTGSVYTNSCEIYNVTSGTWSYTDTVAIKMAYLKAVKLDNGNILVVYANYSQLFDQSTQQWSSVITSNGSWVKYSMSKLADGRVLVAGGASNGTGAEIYDPSINSWTLVSNQMSYDHESASSILLDNGKVMITDGNTNVNFSELFDPVTESFSLSSNEMANDRVSAPMVLLTDGNVLIYGNGDFTPNDTKSLEVYDTTTNKWYSAGQNNIIGSGFDYTIHRLNTGKILLIGGWTFGGSTRTCYLVDENYIFFPLGIFKEDTKTKNLISIYPNPTYNYLNINIESQEVIPSYTLTIYQMSKNTVVNKEIHFLQESLYSVDISELSNGVYFVKLQSGDYIWTKKIIKM